MPVCQTRIASFNQIENNSHICTTAIRRTPLICWLWQTSFWFGYKKNCYYFMYLLWSAVVFFNTKHRSNFLTFCRFEDGTLPFLSILALRHGFETLKRFSLDFNLISRHTFNLAQYVYRYLLRLHHTNGSPVAMMYHDTDFEDRNLQGGIVNFNLLRMNGEYVGYAEVCK